jgi:hypothetical protein
MNKDKFAICVVPSSSAQSEVVTRIGRSRDCTKFPIAQSSLLKRKGRDGRMENCSYHIKEVLALRGIALLCLGAWRLDQAAAIGHDIETEN